MQGALEAQLTQKLGGTLVRVVGASRTDTGVHARGQMVHFDLPARAALRNEEQLGKFEFTLNRMLPPDVRVFQLEKAPNAEGALRDRFSAIYDAVAKLYSYRVSVAAVPDPLERLYRHHEWRCGNEAGFDMGKAVEAAKVFEGTHDFTAFTNMGPKLRNGANVAPVMKNPVRTVRSVCIVDEGRGRFRLDFVLEGALYRMVRNMVGGVLEVGVGRMEVDDLRRLLEERDRTKAPKSASARGLCLEHVYYDI